MAFDDDERSASGSRPIDLYTIQTPTVTYRMTSNIVDVAFGGETYTALTMSRGNLQSSQDMTGRELVVYLPLAHPIVQRFAASGIPEHEVRVTLHRLQASGAAIQEGCGFAQSMSVDRGVAILRVPALTDDAMKIRLPTIRAQKLCNHVLYDPQCTKSRDLFSTTTTIASLTSTTVTVAAAMDGTQIVYGDVEHVATGQRRMVIAQAESVLTINAPFVSAQAGDVVRVAQGCDHTLLTCKTKFNNVVNFGGFPHMNSAINPWAPGGLGMIEQQ